MFIGFGRLCFRTSFSDNLFSLYTIIIIRVGSRTLAGSKGEFFCILVKGFQLLALVIRNSILDLSGLLDPPLFNNDTLGETSVASFCSDHVINLSYVLFYVYLLPLVN